MRTFALLTIAVLLALNLARHWGDEPVIMIDGAALFATAAGDDRLCDVPAHRAPILDSPKHRLDYRQGRPYGDRGLA